MSQWVSWIQILFDGIHRPTPKKSTQRFACVIDITHFFLTLVRQIRHRAPSNKHGPSQRLCFYTISKHDRIDPVIGIGWEICEITTLESQNHTYVLKGGETGSLCLRREPRTFLHQFGSLNRLRISCEIFTLGRHTPRLHLERGRDRDALASTRASNIFASTRLFESAKKRLRLLLFLTS